MGVDYLDGLQQIKIFPMWEELCKLDCGVVIPLHYRLPAVILIVPVFSLGTDNIIIVLGSLRSSAGVVDWRIRALSRDQYRT